MISFTLYEIFGFPWTSIILVLFCLVICSTYITFGPHFRLRTERWGMCHATAELPSYIRITRKYSFEFEQSLTDQWILMFLLELRRPCGTHRRLIVDAFSTKSRSYASNSCRLKGYMSHMMFLYLENAIINLFIVELLNNLILY